GLIAGVVNCTLALTMGEQFPAPAMTATMMAVGLMGYGVSLVLFVLALRGLGTARTGAYFSTAPFVGALIALTVLGESASPVFWLASALMVWGVWLHLTEKHEHEHSHERLEHSHSHRHDEHHQHDHEFAWHGQEPHSHPHSHALVTHKHPHFPDLHHRHAH
ncbi:MAG TPA: EamA family transporter, partial [Candidatus Accumulibacter sp.]|nr:EamA family transporter [Accumulibacter sp.]